MNKKGKIAIIIIIIINLCILGYYYSHKSGVNILDSGLETKMKTASEAYFNEYVRTNETASTYEVKLSDLEKANSEGKSYDLGGLEKCNKEETLSKITINFKDGNIKRVEVELKC